MTEFSRREFLTLAGISGLALLSGCSSADSGQVFLKEDVTKWPVKEIPLDNKPHQIEGVGELVSANWGLREMYILADSEKPLMELELRWNRLKLGDRKPLDFGLSICKPTPVNGLIHLVRIPLDSSVTLSYYERFRDASDKLIGENPTPFPEAKYTARVQYTTPRPLEGAPSYMIFTYKNGKDSATSYLRAQLKYVK